MLHLRQTARSCLAFLLCVLTPACSATQAWSGGAGLLELEEVEARDDVPAIAWLHWRGPLRNGTSLEVDLPEKLAVEEDVRWTFERRGRGCPVYFQGRFYGMGYTGEGPELQELIYCVDEQTGALIWEHGFSDFLSDIVYDRYSIGSPVIDAESGHVYCNTVPGLLNCFTLDGEHVWQVSLMEEYGRLTYPNGRTLGPTIEDDLVILHTMNATWGKAEVPPRDRFFAFDKRTGELVWMTNPSGPPKDAPYSHPVLEWRDGQRLLYAGEAGGLVVCVNARTGEPVWQYRMSVGAVGSSAVLYGDHLIAIHGKENIDSSEAGRMVAIDLTKTPTRPGPNGQVELDRSCEAWRTWLSAFTSSPVLVGDRVYQTTDLGELACVNADTGEVLWREKLAPDQIHASPTHGDGKLYVPMNNGSFFVIRPGDEGPETLSRTQLEGNCLGAPCIANGKVVVHTTERLYCFGNESGRAAGVPPAEVAPAPGAAVAIQVIPAEVRLQPGDVVKLRARALDEHGLVVADPVSVTAMASAGGLSVSFESGALSAAEDAAAGAAALTFTSDAYPGLSDTARVRIVENVPFTYDFEDFELDQTDAEGKAFGLPPAQWIQGRAFWDVRGLEDGNQVLAKTTDNNLRQRGMCFLGDADLRNYTMQADLMSEGNRRLMSTVGLVHQRYLILLKCNHREVEIQSNEERVKHAVPFSFEAGQWYTLKSMVRADESGAATIRAKVWPRGEAEPEAWTLEYVHRHGHTHGSPGVYGFALQNRFKVYLDNLSVTPGTE